MLESISPTKNLKRRDSDTFYTLRYVERNMYTASSITNFVCEIIWQYYFTLHTYVGIELVTRLLAQRPKGRTTTGEPDVR